MKQVNELFDVVLIHGQFQILARIYNNMMQMTITPTYVVLSPLLFSTAVYSLVLLGTSIDMASLITLVITLSISMSQNFVGFYFAIQVFKESSSIFNRKLIFQNMKGNPKENRYFQKMVTRYWKSFPLIKIYFFHGSFFEDCTCLVLLDFSVNQAVNLLLL